MYVINRGKSFLKTVIFKIIKLLKLLGKNYNAYFNALNIPKKW